MSTGTGPSHERIDELIALDAIGGLEEADRAELQAILAEHGDDCAGCDERFAAYAEAAATLAMALEPVGPSAGAEDRLIAAARARDAGPHADGVSDTAPSRPALSVVPGDGGTTDVARDEAPALVRPRRVGRWIAAAAVAAALLVGGVSGFVAAPRPPAGTTQFLSFAAQPGTRFASFPTSDGTTLTVAYRPNERRAWIFGSGLDKPAGGRTYELWWGTKGTPLEGMHAAGIFVPIHGDIIAPVSVDASQPGTVLGVTIEPPGGSPEPTSAPILATTV